MEQTLESKVRYFLSSRYRGRDEVRAVLRTLKWFGRLGLVGGMLRDIALFGNAAFRSDLDFVIDPYDLDAFDSFMLSKGAKLNRFGGYSLPEGAWHVDIWPIQRTWAHRAGVAKINRIGDLTSATFFNCDAVVYDMMYQRIITKPLYFEELCAKILDINLLPNPNPSGNAVRALRYSVAKGFRWSIGLSSFVADTIDSVGWDYLVNSERRSFSVRYLPYLDSNEFVSELRMHVSRQSKEFFDPKQFRRPLQLSLFS